MVSKGACPCIGCPRLLAKRPSEHDCHERCDLGRLRGSPGNVGLTDHRQYAAAIIDRSDGHYAIIKAMPLAESRFGPVCIRSIISDVAATRHSSHPRFRTTLFHCLAKGRKPHSKCRLSSTTGQLQMGFIVRRPIVYILFDLSLWWMNRQLWG
jgi:hypothetical protein